MTAVEFGFPEPPNPLFWQEWVYSKIKEYDAELKDEFGEYTLIPVEDSCRVRLAPEAATSKEEWFVCYPSHYTTGARLIVDDYAPENIDPAVNLDADVD